MLRKMFVVAIIFSVFRFAASASSAQQIAP
jgi:hypothetical protein